MKILHQINFWALVTNCVLFIIPTLGMLAMIPLGILQLILAVAVLFCYYPNADRKRRVLVLRYWLFVAIDFAGIGAAYYYDRFSNDLYSVPFLFVFPACIAIYFVYTTYSITKYFNHGNAAPQP